MSNADGQIVPIVEGDQGEGYQDVVEENFDFGAAFRSRSMGLRAVCKLKEHEEVRDTELQKKVERIEKKVNLLLAHFGLAKDEILIV